jgi:hypothetical protein
MPTSPDAQSARDRGEETQRGGMLVKTDTTFISNDDGEID